MERATRQRRAIRQVLQESPHPLTPQAILDKSKKSVPQLGLATVYRTLRALMEEHFAVLVEMPGSTPHYAAAADNPQQHHHHFYCQRCEHVYELEGCVPAVTALAPPTFQVERHEIFLYGVCAPCANKNQG